MTQIETIKQYAKDLTVLYAEDDLQTQKAMQSILSVFFKHVYVANNGQEGLEIFKNNQPDMIISDINMPGTSGLEMVQAVRSVDQEIPVMIITAYSDTSYLMDSIFLGIDRYATKPLNEEEFFKNLLVLVKSVHQKREALAYQKAQAQARLNEAALDALKDTAGIYPSPTFVFDEEKKLIFINSAGSKIFSQEELDLLLGGDCVDSFVVKKHKFMHSLHEPLENKDQKIILKTNGVMRIFLLNKAQLQPGEHPLTLFSLTDITRVEYEKQKSQNLSAYLHDVLRQGRKKTTPAQTLEKSPPQIPSIEILKAPLLEPLAPKAPQTYEQSRLSAMHSTRKESAKEYIASLSAQLIEELQEMEELEKEMGETFVELEEHFNLSSLHSVARYFQHYGKTIGSMIDFEDVAYSLQNLCEFLLALASVEFNQKKMLILLQAVSEDLMNWRQTIFVDQSSNDIHYLDASLLSSCLQIKMDFGEGESQGDDMEFF